MPFCISCGAENPEGAKFCAKCGAKQTVEEQPADLPMPAPPPPTPAVPQPAAPPPAAPPPEPGGSQPSSQLEGAAEPEHITLKPKPKPAPAPTPAPPPAAPAPAPEPKTPTAPPAPAPSGPMTAKEALKSPQVKPQKGSAKEPIPGAPGQTQFFMAAAQVSTGAKIRRVLIFVLGAIIVGTGLFLLIRFAMQQQEQKREAMGEKPAEASTAPAATAPAPEAVESKDGGAVADGAAAADASKEEAKAAEKEPSAEEKKTAKKKKKKKRRKRRNR